jgi:DNA-binding response OmpR family regulator
MVNKGFDPNAPRVIKFTDDPGGETAASILMLEDSAEQTVSLKEFLEANNYKVTTAANGVEGLKHVLASDYDVIICDMMMPNLPGDMFYLAVEKTKPHLCRRFIFISGYKNDPKIDGFIRKVKGLMLNKPLHIRYLLDSIKLVLKKNQAGANAVPTAAAA